MTSKQLCELCGGEGRNYTSRYGGNDPDAIDMGLCKACDGTGYEQPQTKRQATGGPTDEEPDRPYCKSDQSCCDFCCGN